MAITFKTVAGVSFAMLKIAGVDGGFIGRGRDNSEALADVMHKAGLMWGEFTG